MPSFGWSYLSREALRRAEAQLADGARNVRDEIGFLLIHQRYADRFFPGTSVLHTRLRYALFVPWMYERLASSGSATQISRAVQAAEIELAGRLKAAGRHGVIGGTKHPAPASQPPSIAYWSALGAWGILRPLAGGRTPSRARVHADLQKSGSQTRRTALDDDGVPLHEGPAPFVALPKPPELDGGGELDFDLTAGEAAFLRARLEAVVSPHDRGKPSLLARLASAGVPDAPACWSPEVVSLAGQDGEALRNAGRAASLAAVGRAVYAALVEDIRENDDRTPTTRIHRDALPEVVERHAHGASCLDMAALADDLGHLPREVTAVLSATLEWIAGGANDVKALREPYATAERRRKGERSRLWHDLNARERRHSWDNALHAAAQPLHYRWDRVHQLLSDLEAPARATGKRA